MAACSTAVVTRGAFAGGGERAAEGEEDGLGAGGGDDEAAGLDAEQGGELGAGEFEGVACVLSGAVDGGGVVPEGFHAPRDGPARLGRGARGGVVVEVDGHGGW